MWCLNAWVVGGPLQNAMKKLAKSGGKKKEKKQWAQPSGGDKPKKEKKAEVGMFVRVGMVVGVAGSLEARLRFSAC